MEQTKVVYHGTTVAGDGAAPSNPPPYSSGPYPGTYGPPPPGPTVVHATVVPTVVPVMVGQQMGPSPTVMTCKSCHCDIVTRVDKKPTLRTHLFAALLCIIGCWPCVCLPYCVDSCLNTDHYCPNCNSYIGSYLA